MALGDGIRRNLASVDPTERALLRDALIELNRRLFPGNRTDSVPGGVSWWFKQDEIHQATHVHRGPEFLPWHREIVNRFEELVRQINPQLSLHYWDWTQDPRAIPNANLGGGVTGTLNLFTTDFMGYGGSTSAPIGEPWLSAGYYVPGTTSDRDATSNPADPPRTVSRSVGGFGTAPASANQDQAVVAAGDYATMRRNLERVHDYMHGFVNMGSQHFSFRDPFVFLLHSNVDRLFALWQLQPGLPQRLDPNLVYAPESGDPRLNSNIEPWSTGHAFDEFGIEHFTRPWYAPENQGVPKTYKHPSIVGPPRYDTNPALPTGPAAQGDDMQPGEVLTPDQSITSANGRYRFIYQGDGNLVLYDGGTPLWASGTDGGRWVSASCRATATWSSTLHVQPIWSSDTWQHPGSRLVIQDDGNVVIYRPDGTPVWATNTWLPAGPAAQGDDMQPGEVLNPDQSITSANGRYRFIYQGDGNLVLYDGGTPLWASGTDGRPVGVCIMQGDGNLVIYARGGQPIWDSGTWENPGSRLVVQDDGNVVIYRPDGLAVWATNTWLPGGPAAQGDDMQPGEVLTPDQSITSANGRYRFIYQGDGNLVLYDGGTPLWASGTDGRPWVSASCRATGTSSFTLAAASRLDSGTWQPRQPAGRPRRRQRGDLPPGRPSGVGDEHLAPGWAGRPRGTTCSRGRYSTPDQSITSETAATASSIRAMGTWCATMAAHHGGLLARTEAGGVGIMHGRQLGHLRSRRPADLGFRHLGKPGSRPVVQDDGNVVITARTA